MSTLPIAKTKDKSTYAILLLLVVGFAALLHGMHAAIIAGPFPHLEAMSGLTATPLSFVVAMLMCSAAFSPLCLPAHHPIGRTSKAMVPLNAILFIVSIPLIALADDYGPMALGRLLLEITAALISLLVPLYLARAFAVSNCFTDPAVLQRLLILGLILAALIGIPFSLRVTTTPNPDSLLPFETMECTNSFWLSLSPGILLVIGRFVLAESPRWILRLCI